jgi:Protein kinase domain
MPKLNSAVTLETAFDSYVVDELIGEGGAGRVYGGIAPDRAPIAIKILAPERVSRDKRARFKNEIAFLARNKHANIVTVLDHGVANAGNLKGPFYVMRRYEGNLRDLMPSRISAEKVLPLFSQMLDGVEAAHLQRVIHRDLKPENFLHTNGIPAVADFGIASFTDDLLATLVETQPTQRLANFQYAAPEQRVPGRPVTATADIYALGLILNEMFTGSIPHGTEYQVIGAVAKEFAFLDGVVAKMIRQAPGERPGTIAEVKALIQRHQSEAVSLQRLSKIDGTVIKAGEVDEPLAHEPPRLVGADWNNGVLTLTLDRPVNPNWVRALHNMGSYASVYNIPPQVFSFSGDRATVQASDGDAQRVIDHFKEWLPKATRTLKHTLEEKAQHEQREQAERLRRECLVEEQRLRLLQTIKI